MNQRQFDAVKKFMLSWYGNETVARNMTEIMLDEMTTNGWNAMAESMKMNGGFSQIEINLLARLIEENK